MSRYVSYTCSECGHVGPFDLGPDPVASPAPLDAYDMRIMVRALYTSGLTDEMNPSDRRKAALRLRATLQEQRARALEGQPAGEEPSDA